VSPVFKTALAAFFLIPSAAWATVPRVGLVSGPATSEIERLRAENALRSLEILQFAGRSRVDRTERSAELGAAGGSLHADLLVVTGDRSIRVFDVVRRHFVGEALPADATAREVQRLAGTAIERWQRTHTGLFGKPWVGYVVAGAAAVAFVLVIALRSGRDDSSSSQGLTVRFVSP
jgi:hypothetical protein